MTGLIRFLQNSVEEIHDSVRTYTTRTLIVPCQLCKRHVHIRVMDVLSRPDRPIDMECKHCSHIVCFTSGGRPSTNLAASGSFESHRSGQAIYSEPLPLGTVCSRGLSLHGVQIYCMLVLIIRWSSRQYSPRSIAVGVMVLMIPQVTLSTQYWESRQLTRLLNHQQPQNQGKAIP